MNNEQTIKQLLDLLAEMQAQRQLVELNKQAAINKVLTPEIKAQIADIEAEFSGKIEAVNANIAESECQIKVQVIELGTTVKGIYLQAVWTKPRISWSDAALEGYAIDHPELLAFQTIGKPSVSIRKV